jgi:hypothetical protein
LSFDLVVPLGDECAPIVGYLLPDEIVPGPYSTTVNGAGVLQWNAPQIQGFYTVAIRCTEWREGEMIGAVTRDMMFCALLPFTAVPEENGPSLVVLQTLPDGPISIRINDWSGSSIDIFEAGGALTQHVRPTGIQTTLPTDELTPGVYVLKATDTKGGITAGRFVVTR